MLRFKCLGIPVRVEPFFWVTMGVLGVLNATSRSGSSPQDLLLVALFMLAGFISILVHEMGHALAARHYGAQVDITLHAMGGVARHYGTRLNRMRSIIITAAGPLLQLALGILVIMIARNFKPAAFEAQMFLLFLIRISIVWSIFNLLPIIPMDGGRIVEAALGPRRIRITLGIGIGTCVLMGLWAIQQGLPFIAAFMAIFGYQSWKVMQQMKWRR